MKPVLEFVRQHHEADDVTSFFFLPRQPLSFVPGQYIDLSVPHAHPDSRGMAFDASGRPLLMRPLAANREPNGEPRRPIHCS